MGRRARRETPRPALVVARRPGPVRPDATVTAGVDPAPRARVGATGHPPVGRKATGPTVVLAGAAGAARGRVTKPVRPR